MYQVENFDDSVRPQDDFYGYVNNNWLKANPIPDSEAKWGVFIWLREENWKKLDGILKDLASNPPESGLGRQLAEIYLSTQDEQKVAITGKQKLEAVLSQIAAIQDKQDVLEFIYESQRAGLGFLWSWYVDLDNKNSTRYAFYLHQGGLGLPDRDYYTKDDEQMQKVREAYVPHIAKLLQKVSYDSPLEASQRIYELEKKLAEKSWTATELRDIEKMYNPYTEQELQSKLPALGWSKFLETLGVNEPQVIVDTPSFFEAVNSLIEEVSVNTWKDYLTWHTLRKLNSGLGEEFALAQFEFYGKILGGTKELQPRWKRIVLTLEGLIGEGMGQFFVKQYFPEEAKNRMEELVKDLKLAFKNRLEQASWMSQETKEHALVKLDKMRIKVGYPNKWQSYEGLVTSDESFIENILEACRFEANRSLKKLGSEIDKEEWCCSPQTVNAYAYFNLNEITFPAGILQAPYFDIEATEAENFGAIGTVIGHEITHGFDDKGSLFDAEGNMHNWRKEADAKKFAEMTQGLVVVANAYEVLPGKFLNGELTLGENTADFGGVEIALDALSIARGGKLERQELQNFFVAMARVWAENIREEKMLELLTLDPHAPEKFRTNIALAHNDRFASAFELKPGDKLYVKPEERVKIW
jgi:predicted metalloendopeptidase